jgi:hypothetical protein
VRNIKQNLLSALSSIKDNSANSQILAAITLVQMQVAPVISIHIPFGGDNHRDVALANETTQTVSGVATIASLLSQLQSAGLQDQVSFMSLNVFGRTIGPGNTDGRQHNQNHQASVVIGSPFKSAVVGGVAPVGSDYGATTINSKTGAGGSGGDIEAIDTLSAFAMTMLASVGADPTILTSPTMTAKVVSAALV